MSSNLTWLDVEYRLQDGAGSPISLNDVLPYPQTALPTTPTGIKALCTLPPLGIARHPPSPNLLEPMGWRDLRDSFGSQLGSTSGRSCVRSTSFGDQLNPQCLWDELTQVPSSILKASDDYCLPFDDPALLKDRNGVLPVPHLDRTNNSTFMTHPPLHNLVLPALKHLLETRNHSAALWPIFSNVTVRPGHKRLRLGMRAPVPPIGAPCSLSAISNVTGTIASDWSFAAGWSTSRFPAMYQILLAYPTASVRSLIRPSLDHAASGSHASKHPFPFLTYRAQEAGDAGSRWSSGKAWVMPFVACRPTTANASLGAIHPLVVQGTCTQNRDCLSGVCNVANATCDNSIKPETQSPFSPKFMIDLALPRMLAYPTDGTVRQALDRFRTYVNRQLPEMWMYYWPLFIAGGVVFAVLCFAALWTSSNGARVRKWLLGWQLTTERDLELKPVSGRMVADLGDERAVQEAVVAGQEELPVYVEP